MIKNEKRSQVSLGYWPLNSHSWHLFKYDFWNVKVCLNPNMFLALDFLLSGITSFAMLPTITARAIRDPKCMCCSKSLQSARNILVTFCSVSLSFNKDQHLLKLPSRADSL